MELFLERGFASVNKTGEELCGDRVQLLTTDTHLTFVLADGLGSGVKANILATLTSTILCTMVSEGIGIEDCIETILATLPVCKVRNVAYSTFSVLHIDKSGYGYLVEFDNPQAIVMRTGRAIDLERTELIINEKTVYQTPVQLCEGDTILMFSDGAVHAGIGRTLSFGWNRSEIAAYLESKVTKDMSAQCISTLLCSACNDLYLGQPGDDTTVVALKLRECEHVNIMVGPPANAQDDFECIAKFLDGNSKKIVCGGTRDRKSVV